MTTEHTFALVTSATIPFAAIPAHDRLVVIAGMGVAPLAGTGAVFVGRSNTRGIATGSLHAVAPVAGSGAVASLVADPAVARTATLAFPLAVGCALGVASTRGRLRLGMAVSAFTFIVPAWTYSPSTVKAAGSDLETIGLILDFTIATAPLSLPLAAIDHVTTRTADAGRQAGASPAASTAEQQIRISARLYVRS